jgi:aminopeptidase N
MSQDTTQYLKDYKTPDHTISDISLTFELDENATIITAISTVVTLKSNVPLVLDGEDLTLVSVSINNQEIKDTGYQLIDSQLIIDDVPARFELTIVTQVNPSENTKLEGLYIAGDAFCSQCEAQGFRRITYYLDRPDVMAVYTTKVIADKLKYPYLLSNGNKVDSGDLPDNRHFATWNDPFKKPAYLFALVAGDFDLLEGEFITKSNRRVALEFFVDKGNKAKAEFALASLQRAMKWDEERFNLEYDLDIYMVVAVDFFNMGAMENKGLNVFNSKYVLADSQSATDKDFHGIESVIGHEYFHNWTGNRITCRDWFQLSLKEGLTVFRDQEFSSDLGSRAVNRIDAVKVIRSHQFSEDAGPMAHPIRPQAVIEMNNFYTVTVYNKGAEVIRMIHTLLGEEKFQAGMTQYITQFDGMAVTCDDFIDAMQAGSGVELTQFRLWYEQSGTPRVALTQHYDSDDKLLTLTFTQQSTGLANDNALLIPINIEFINSQGQVQQQENRPQTLCLAKKRQSFSFSDIDEGTVSVLLGDFSAPIKLDTQYTLAQLIHILAYSTNDFSRWDSAQQLLTTVIMDNAARLSSDMSVDKELINAVNLVLANEKTDPALIALMLDLPSDMALFELVEEVNVDDILRAKAFVKSQITLNCYQALSQSHQRCISCLEICPQTARASYRALKQTLAGYLCQSTDYSALDKMNKLIVSQFNNANEMTDSINALTTACIAQLPCFTSLSQQFCKRWSDNGLVMDKWFATIGQWPNSDVIEKINDAMNQNSFTWNNPNRVRSLLGAFAQGNAKQFHAIDGSGYQYLTDQLIRLNDINPQIAARLITPLLSWKKFDNTRSLLMRNELEKLASLKGLSKDLKEKVSLSLIP